jgi:hypothetical protein
VKSGHPFTKPLDSTSQKILMTDMIDLVEKNNTFNRKKITRPLSHNI